MECNRDVTSVKLWQEAYLRRVRSHNLEQAMIWGLKSGASGLRSVN